MYDFWLPAYSIYLPVKHQEDGEVVSEESWDRRTREFTIRECGEKKNRGIDAKSWTWLSVLIINYDD